MYIPTIVVLFFLLALASHDKDGSMGWGLLLGLCVFGLVGWLGWWLLVVPLALLLLSLPVLVVVGAVEEYGWGRTLGGAVAAAMAVFMVIRLIHGGATNPMLYLGAVAWPFGLCSMIFYGAAGSVEEEVE